MLFPLCFCCSGKLREDAKSCEKGGKTRKEKEQCSDASSLRRVGRETSRVADIPEDSWLCLHHRRQDKRCSCPSFWGHGGGLAKSKIPTRLYVVFEDVGRRLSGYKPGTNWCNLCRRKADENFRDHELYHSSDARRKRAACDDRNVKMSTSPKSPISKMRHLTNKYDVDSAPLYDPATMRDFAKKYVPGLYSTILNSIARCTDSALQEKRTVTLLHTLAYFGSQKTSKLQKDLGLYLHLHGLP
ncbi:uncharacterized protein LOC116614318 isoform X3 [Nematostella vectensis]|uniref:uncharacterized protein LOC116614318 isoform X3 n=1 Tax=Nematostella vectensis TaxID=45351 RepID=UPI002076DE8D|nr:uncharacterized protein LOC116614318 isoform X3 [Nematostella vectensis]